MNIPMIGSVPKDMVRLIENDAVVQECIKLMESLSKRDLQHIHEIIDYINVKASENDAATTLAITYLGALLQAANQD